MLGNKASHDLFFSCLSLCLFISSFWVPASLWNDLNISFRNFYITVARVRSFIFLTLGGGIADLQWESFPFVAPTSISWLICHFGLILP